MTTPAGQVDFYFDFSSPYSYMAAERIDALAARHGHTVNWKPIMLGVIFKSTGAIPLVDQHPWKAQYAVMDFQRSARMAGLPFRTPSRFPQAGHHAARILIALQASAPDKAAPFARAVFRALFSQDADIQSIDTLAAIGTSLGIDETVLRAAGHDAAVKAKLVANNDEAVHRQVFGAPTFFVGDEQFWGHDRMAHLEQRLAEIRGR